MKLPNTQSPPPPNTNAVPEGWSIADMRIPKYHSRVSTFWMGEADRLHAALDKFGWHNHKCESLSDHSADVRIPEKVCTCGFDAALADEKREGK